MTSSTWKIWYLIGMSIVGVILGIWLTGAGFTVLGCLFIGLFLWRAQQSALWLIVLDRVPSEITPRVGSSWQARLLAIICLLGAAVCAIGVYLWRLWPEEWQAGLVFILFGMLVLAPVTIWQVQLRRKATVQIQAPSE